MRPLAVLTLALTLVAGQPRPGVAPDNQFQTSATRWSSQVMLEAQHLRDALAAAPTPRLREMARTAEQLHGSATQFYRLVRTAPARDRLRTEFQLLDRSLNTLVEAVRTTAKAERQPALLAPASQLEYAGEQLSYWIFQGDDRADRRRTWLVRQTRALDNQSDDLLRAAAEVLRGDAFGRQLERDVRAFNAQVDRFRQSVEGNAPRDQVERAFDPVDRSWGQVQQGLNASAAVWQYGELRRQGGQIGQLVQNVASALGRPAPPPQPIPVPPPPGPGPGPRPPRLQEFYAIGADAGGGPHVRVFHSRRPTDFASFYAYDPDFKGGVRVAVGDVTGDGLPDLITAPGPGMDPIIRVFDGRDMSLVREFVAFDPPYQQGCWVAAGDLLNNRRAEIVVGTGDGVPARVRTFDAANGRAISDFLPYEQNFRGGVQVALGDINGDGVPDFITTPGPGRPVLVRVFDGRNPANVLGQFDAYDLRFVGGAFVAAADLHGDGRAEIITGAGANGGPHVRVFTGANGRLLSEFFAYDQQFLGGVRVACRDVTGDGIPDIITAPGPGGPPLIRAFDGRNQRQLFEFSAFDPQFVGGAFVGSR
jgi:hypothetical protein